MTKFNILRFILFDYRHDYIKEAKKTKVVFER